MVKMRFWFSPSPLLFLSAANNLTIIYLFLFSRLSLNKFAGVHFII